MRGMRGMGMGMGGGRVEGRGRNGIGGRDVRRLDGRFKVRRGRRWECRGSLTPLFVGGAVGWGRVKHSGAVSRFWKKREARGGGGSFWGVGEEGEEFGFSAGGGFGVLFDL